jgi:hypothetical protein
MIPSVTGSQDDKISLALELVAGPTELLTLKL